MHKVLTPQVVDPMEILVDQVMNLLGKPVIIGNVHHELRKDFHGFILPHSSFDIPDPGGRIAKDHRETKDEEFFCRQPHEHVFNTDLKVTIDACRQGFIVLVGREFTVSVKDICRGKEDELTGILGYILHEVLVGL